MTAPLDELDRRIRSLEAERLRPVPPRPGTDPSSPGARLVALVEAADRWNAPA